MTDDITTSNNHNSVSVDYKHCLYDNKIKPVLVGRVILEKFRDRYNFVITKGDKEIWRYNGDGYYIKDGEQFILNQVQNILNYHCNSHIKNETISYIKDLGDIQVSYDDFNSRSDLINLNNGVYDLGTGEFKEHDYNYLFTGKLPITYNPKADCPKIKKFLNEVLRQEDIPIIQELAGYILLKNYKFHKAFMFIGSGRNGKSTLINLLSKFVGKENVSDIDLQSLDSNRFSIINLYGKLINAHSEISNRALRNTGFFKQLVGQDSISADRKFLEPISFTNYAKLIFSCNELPKSYDDTFAFYSRWIILEFDNIFEGNKCNPNLLQELSTEKEISGFFNWAIEGLNRLLSNGRFSHSKSTEQVKEEWIKHSHPVLVFINNYIDINPEYEVSKDELYNAYKEFCDKLDIDPIAKNMFSREIGRHIKKVEGKRRKVDNRFIKFWQGIGLRNVDLEDYPIK